MENGGTKLYYCSTMQGEKYFFVKGKNDIMNMESWMILYGVVDPILPLHCSQSFWKVFYLFGNLKKNLL